MKNIKIVIVFFLVQFCYTQVDGTYRTNYGIVKLIQEDSIVYGDYGERGTVVGKFVADKFTGHGYLVGTFAHGDNKWGSFKWNFLDTKIFGKWGWNTSLSGGDWNGEIIYDKPSTTLKSAIWSGTWQTTFGTIVLEQTGNKVKGKYKNVGYIEATIVGDKLIGTFTNNGRTGNFEFTMECNAFKGKWSWNNALNEIWNGTKATKTNLCDDSPYAGLYRITVVDIQTSFRKSVLASTVQLYGSIGVRIYGKSESGTVEVSSINNIPPRIWDVSSSNTFDIKQDSGNRYQDENGTTIFYLGKRDINKERLFLIKGELANQDLQVNLQCNISEELNLRTDTDFGFQQKSTLLKDLKMGKPNYLVIKKGDDTIRITYKVDKL
ncbi:hypothetical protein GOQ30_09965 [Flavobacterium sp. TP390]|uniref:Uncharacterized protein n=1 Tax=Flavobacterium profundi TaxID=1774945 RepID=A0A6I4ILV6_9FLAO|nr:hypothetical protein [Flavobacterium profundi]MVO09482.1 hypothetical protein [Flavobacterium profundi]